MESADSRSAREGAIRTDGVSRAFGSVLAVDDVSVSFASGRLSSLIGANGAGKTTLLNLCSGVLRPTRGHVWLHGRDVTNVRPTQRARRGLARTFQHSRLVSGLTCLENVMLGRRRGTADGERRWDLDRWWRGDETLADFAAEMLAKVGLPKDYWLADPSAIPAPHRRWVELARALAAEPSVLLLDEPNSGLAAAEVDYLTQLLLQLDAEPDLTVVLVTHDVSLAARVSHEIGVMDSGQFIAFGAPEEIMSSPEVVSAYLGELGRDAARAALEKR